MVSSNWSAPLFVLAAEAPSISCFEAAVAAEQEEEEVATDQWSRRRTQAPLRPCSFIKVQSVAATEDFLTQSDWHLSDHFTFILIYYSKNLYIELQLNQFIHIYY